MKDLFFPDRLGRLSFFIRAIILSIPNYSLAAQVDNGDGSVYVIIVLIAIVAYTAFAVYLPRIVDCGGAKWTIVLSFVPLVASVFAFYLLFRPSEFTTMFGDGGGTDVDEPIEER